MTDTKQSVEHRPKCEHCGKHFIPLLSHAMDFYKYCSNACEDDAYDERVEKGR